MRCATSIFCLLTAVWALPAVDASGSERQPRFYLSTSRPFSPDEGDIAVQLEAQDLEAIDIRLYRISDPEKFFADQADLHRIETENGPRRASSLDLLDEVRRLGMTAIFGETRSMLTRDTRLRARETYGGDIDAFKQKAEATAPPSTLVPLLQGLELVDLWTEEFERGSEWTYRDIPLAVRSPGLYLLEGVHGSEVGYTAVIVSRMALLTRQSRDQLLVFAVDPQLGTPLPNAVVRVFKDGSLFAEGTTGSDGLLQKEIPLSRELRVFARRGEDVALIDPVYHPANLFSRKVYLTTERPVYRPGQEVFWKGVVRGFQGESYKLEVIQDAIAVQIRDPNGQRVCEQKVRLGPGGSFDGRCALFPGAAVGSYRLVAEIQGREYGGEFKVKEYQKPEIKVQVEPQKKACVSGETVQATIQANYFFGPPVPGAKVQVSVYRTRFYVPWWVDADYSWYYSDAEYKNTLRETLEEKEGKLDRQGRFEISFATKPDSLDYTYGIEAVVTDAAGRGVTGSTAVRVTRARFRLVVEPALLLNAPGVETAVRVQTTDFGREPVAADVNLRVSARFDLDAPERQVLERRVQTGERGQAQLVFTPSLGGVYTIAAVAQDGSGNQVEGRAVLYVTSDGRSLPAVPQELEIIADRRTFKVGDRARILLLTPHADSHLLVTVEGGRLYQAKVLQARGSSAVLELPIDEAQAPNFFLQAAQVIDGALIERRLDVVVPPREKLLRVAIRPDRPEVKPGETAKVEVAVQDADGKPVSGAEVALALVDEAVYAISPEIATPIERFFYHRKRNDVRSSSSLEFRFYGYGQETRDKMAALLLREPVVPGSFKALADSVRTEFRDTLAFFPALLTNSAGLARTEVRVPDNLTTWRATARVATHDTRVGQGTGALRVSKPVVVRLAAPAYWVEGDESSLGILVHNYTGEKHSFALALEASSDALALSGEPKALEVGPGGVGAAAFRVRAVKPGKVVLRARARDGALEDGLELTRQIRPFGVEQVLLAGGTLDDERPSASVTLEVPASAAPGSARATVAVSTGVAPALLASVEYLVGFPYGCTEQTMSRFLPDLVLAQAFHELGLKHAELEKELPGYIHAGLARLAQLQHDDGGWGWWEEDQSDPFMTGYVVHGLALAKRLGHPVDGNVLQQGLNRLKGQLGSSSQNSTERSFLLYSLALAGERYESMLDKLAEGKLTEYGRALLAMTLFELGLKERALAQVGAIERVVHIGAQGNHWGSEREEPGFATDPVETTAAVLRSLLQTKPKSPHIGQAVRWLMAAREGSGWRSTRDTAMAVFALVDYLKKAGPGEFDASVEARLNDQGAPPHKLGREDIVKQTIPLLTDAPAQVGVNRIALERVGKGQLFFNASIAYFGREDPVRPRGEALQIQRELFALTSEPSGAGIRFAARPLGDKVRQGDLVLVKLTVRSRGFSEYLQIEDPLVAGFEAVERDRGFALPGVDLAQPGLHREFREGRVAFFLRELRGQRELAYVARATLPGHYRGLPARAILMYDPQIASNSGSNRLQVEE